MERFIASVMADDEETYEQEIQLRSLFHAISSALKRIEKLTDVKKLNEEFQDLTSKLQEAKT